MRYHTIATGFGGRILIAAAPQFDPEIPHSNTEKGFKQEWLFVSLCCAIAAIRLFVFILAFPFFDSSDEASHFDTISRYSHGDIPSELSMYSSEGARIIALYNSPEYLDMPSVNVMPPPGSVTPDEAVKRLTLAWTRRVSHESTSPPVYYAVAGAWYDLGKLCAVEGERLLYWTRLLNIPIYVLMLITAFLLTRELFPSKQFLRLGVPWILAFLPQDIFYSLNNDPMAALLAALALYLIFRLDRAEAPSLTLMAGTGMAAAGAFLTKYSTAPVFALLMIVVWRKQRPILSLRQSIARAAWVPALSTTIPILIWFARNYALWGDPTGMAAKNRLLGWTGKPIAQWLNHPLFSLHGSSAFLAELTRTLWRGEFCWHRMSMGSPAVDAVYVGTSAVFLSCFFVHACMTQPRPALAHIRFAAPFCMLMVALSIGFLVYLSISTDFGECPYPSRDWPYFASGRLMLAALVPFLIMYLSGLDVLLGWLRLRFAYPHVLGLLAITMTVSEILVSRGAFASPYNWFHLH